MHAETLAYHAESLSIGPGPCVLWPPRHPNQRRCILDTPGVATLASTDNRISLCMGQRIFESRSTGSFLPNRSFSDECTIRSLHRAGAIPINAGGKPADWECELAAHFHSAAGTKGMTSAIAPRVRKCHPSASQLAGLRDHAEACAYANWAGKQLRRKRSASAAYGESSNVERRISVGRRNSVRQRGNSILAMDPLAVDAHPDGNSAFGVAGLAGKRWNGLARLSRHSRLQAFSFIRLLGRLFRRPALRSKRRSPHTANRLLRRSFRNWFQPHYPFPFAGSDA